MLVKLLKRLERASKFLMPMSVSAKPWIYFAEPSSFSTSSWTGVCMMILQVPICEHTDLKSANDEDDDPQDIDNGDVVSARIMLQVHCPMSTKGAMRRSVQLCRSNLSTRIER